MEKAIPIETVLGILKGRDCVYFNTVEQDDVDNMIFIGDINGALVSVRKNEKE